MRELRVAIIGHGFMGRAHSNAWKNATNWMDVQIRPVMQVACGTNTDALKKFTDRWGWAEVETDWHKVIARKDVDIVDISTPPWLHRDIAVEAARHGKHIFCEKPMAMDAAEAEEMYAAAEAAGIVHYVNHNYRRVPAVVLAKQLIQQGKVGQVLQWRSAYLNSRWVDPKSPITWALRKEKGGSGVIAGFHSHTVDLARYLVGEVATVTALKATFVKERPLPDGSGQAAVTVEDAASMLVQFENGAIGTFDASSMALGRRNYNYFEIYGTKGSLLFDQERMNELQFYSLEDPEEARGFRKILVTDRIHPYMAAWWPPGHPIGYEHPFHHAVADFLNAIARGESTAPNFHDGVQVMRVLDATLMSAETGQRILVSR